MRATDLREGASTIENQSDCEGKYKKFRDIARGANSYRRSVSD
jgi:hypothetical protein